MRLRISVLGDGAWGTTLAILLAEKPEHAVVLWSARSENARVLRERRENVHLLPGIPIPSSVQLTEDASEACAEAALYIFAIPTVYLRGTLPILTPHLRREIPALSVAKGVENETFRRPSEIIGEFVGSRLTAVLSGPSHAEEVSRGLPASVVVATPARDLGRWIQQLFSSQRFRVYTNDDMIGVELAGGLKNVIGIASGISDGLGLGDNAKAALLTRGLAEMARFGVAQGAHQRTFFGLAGIGDLITTCVSPHGRNHRVGQRLAKGERLESILTSTAKVAEGVYTTRSVHTKASLLNLPMPITAEVYRVLYEGKDPSLAVRDLMLRKPRSETIDPDSCAGMPSAESKP